MTGIDALQTAFSAAGLLVAVGVAAFQYRLQHRVTEIEQARRTDELEARRRADVTASFEPKPNTTGIFHLVVLNKGPAMAKNVTFEIHGGDPLRMEPVSLPLPTLDSGHRFPIVAIPLFGASNTVDVELAWEDESGPRRKSLTLRME